MKNIKKHISFKGEEELLEKLSIISECEGVSVNSKITSLITAKINEFEKEHGEIPIPLDSSSSLPTK